MAKEKKNEDLDLQEEDPLEEDPDQEGCSEENPEVQAQEDSYKDQLTRLAADFTNYKRRVEKEKKDFLALGVKKVALDLLGVIDSFERALDHSDENPFFKEGVGVVYQQLLGLLKKSNICPMEALNEKLDPNRHHAVLVEEKKSVEEGVAIDVIRKGYMINDEVLRLTMAKVSQ